MFSETILYIGLAQSLFAAFVLATKKRVEIADKILIACLLTIALKFIFFAVHLQHGDYFDLQFSMGLVPLSFGPFLYLYTVYLVDRKNKFRPFDLVHTLPFIILTSLYFLFFKDKVDFTDTSYFNSDNLLWVRVLYGLTVFTSIVAYMVLTFIKLRQYRKRLKEQNTYATRQQRLLWLNFIFVLFGLLFMTYFITGGVNAFTYEKVIDTTTLSHVGLTIIAFAVSYFGLRQPTLSFVRNNSFNPPDSEEENAEMFENDEDEGENTKIKSRFTEEEAEILAEKLYRFTADEKPYLNPELTLSDLAADLEMNKNDLTELLNNHVGKNFFSYLNEYRVNAVIERFKDPDFDNYTIIAIAYECGFNSKSTFNSIFKQHTGQTPSEFKKKLSNLIM